MFSRPCLLILIVWSQVCWGMQREGSSASSTPDVSCNRCSICQENLGERYVTTPCGHCFHAACFTQWRQWRLAEGKIPNCPNCRNSPIPELSVPLPIPVLDDAPLPTLPTPRRRVLQGWLRVVMMSPRVTGSPQGIESPHRTEDSLIQQSVQTSSLFRC